MPRLFWCTFLFCFKNFSSAFDYLPAPYAYWETLFDRLFAFLSMRHAVVCNRIEDGSNVFSYELNIHKYTQRVHVYMHNMRVNLRAFALSSSYFITYHFISFYIFFNEYIIHPNPMKFWSMLKNYLFHIYLKNYPINAIIFSLLVSIFSIILF